MRLVTFHLARLIGRRKFDAAIDHLRSGLRGGKSDVDSLEMIAMCHQWADRNDEAIETFRKALALEPASFNSYSQLAQLLAEKGEHENAAVHARKGLEFFPEPLEELPRVIALAHKALCRVVPRLRRAHPDGQLPDLNESNTRWFNWAQEYLAWYDATYDESESPAKH